MDAATGAMGALIPKLLELLKEEYMIQTRVKKDVEFLQLEMKSMEAALHKVAIVPRDQLDEQVKIWANDVRELSYQMEDLVDSFLVRVEDSAPAAHQDTFKGLMKKMGNLLRKGKTRHQIADAIKDIKDQVQEVSARRDRDQRDLVGIEGPRDELIKRLMAEHDVEPKQPPKILSVCGFGGLGKTTVVKAVYDVLRPQFDSGAFVSVGRNPNMKKIFKEILFEIDRKEASQAATMDETQLIKEISRLLQKNRYFIVIDDIWDIRSWEIISSALVNNSCGSIIISTTRISEVASTTCDVYKLQPLCFDRSKELFYKRLSISKGKTTFDQSFELCEKILHRCGGVPLAIITVASLLADKPSEDWSEVYNSIGFGDGHNIQVENTRNILLYSYYDLPCHLRTCLLYLSIFPEDSQIWKHSLIWRWIAEGFVHDKQGTGLFEMGERYFNQLINKNMIQPIETNRRGIVIHCRVHDLVLDMIYFLSKEENFVTVLGRNRPHTTPQINARRLSIQETELEHDDPLVSTPMLQARSFVAIFCRIIAMPSLSKFQVLRVLAIEGCTFTKDSYCHLEHLGSLLQLRYLGVRGTPITELPKDIGNLRFLQTLDLRETKIRELPRGFGLLRKLMCLYLDFDFEGMKDWIRNLTSLEVLSLENVSPCFVEEIGKLTELRELKIGCITLDAKLCADLMVSLGDLQKLQIIQVTVSATFPLDTSHIWISKSYVLSRHLLSLKLQVNFPRLPVWIDSSHLPHLANLFVTVETVHGEDMEILGRFQELITLQIDTAGSSLPDLVGSGAFPKLRYFSCTCKPRFLVGAMPCLEYLHCYVMERWDRDYGSLQNLPCLETVTIVDSFFFPFCIVRYTSFSLIVCVYLLVTVKNKLPRSGPFGVEFLHTIGNLLEIYYLGIKKFWLRSTKRNFPSIIDILYGLFLKGYLRL
uniref:Uncharacterized protein n=1 Tax=Avena sativa TaxID=4498 RepID=A0ACD5XHI5_AVESA